MKTDIEIAQEARMKPITQIAAQLGLEEESVIPYGRYKAKIDHRLIHNAKKQGKLILVTAISPTPAGEGKTTTSVGLADAIVDITETGTTLRENSLEIFDWLQPISTRLVANPLALKQKRNTIFKLIDQLSEAINK